MYIFVFFSDKLDKLIRITSRTNLDLNDLKQRVDRITPFTKVSGPTEKARNVLPLKSINERSLMKLCWKKKYVLSQFVSKVKSYMCSILN